MSNNIMPRVGTCTVLMLISFTQSIDAIRNVIRVSAGPATRSQEEVSFFQDIKADTSAEMEEEMSNFYLRALSTNGSMECTEPDEFYDCTSDDPTYETCDDAAMEIGNVFTEKNPNCCDFGFRRGIKILDDGQCSDLEDGDDPVEDDWCIRNEADGALEGIVAVTCPDKGTVTWCQASTAPFVFGGVFRKAGTAPFQDGDLVCGLDATTSADGDITQIGQGVKGTSHFDFCWGLVGDD